jgi:tRNA(Ile)-lysidine synthase
LLCVSRQDIEAFLQDCGQSYVTDSTNLTDDVVRNKIRLNILPLLREINPSVDGNIQTTARQLADAEKIYDAYVGAHLPLKEGNNNIEINKLLETVAPETILFEWLRRYHFSPATIRQIYRSLNAQSGHLWSSSTHEALIDRGRIIVEPLQPMLPTLRIPETGTYIYHDTLRFSFSISCRVEVERAPICACLDADKVQFPLTIRPVQTGDRFSPFGMKGSRLVSDFLTDRKLTLFDRRRQLVVTDATGAIAWLVGLRPDARFCIEMHTCKMLKIVTQIIS